MIRILVPGIIGEAGGFEEEWDGHADGYGSVPEPGCQVVED